MMMIVNCCAGFNFAAGESDLALVTKEDFDVCNTAEPLIVFQEPGQYIFHAVGTYYLTCTYAGHCSKGQKIALYFAPASTDSPSPSPTPGASQSRQSDAANEQYATAVKFVSKKEYGFKNLMSVTKKSL